MKRAIGCLILALATLGALRAGASETCYYLKGQPVTRDCAGYLEEAENYLARSHQHCAYVLYITWAGDSETVRCRTYSGGFIDYVTAADGNLRPRE